MEIVGTYNTVKPFKDISVGECFYSCDISENIIFIKGKGKYGKKYTEFGLDLEKGEVFEFGELEEVIPVKAKVVLGE